MEKIKAYIDSMVEDGKRVKDNLEKDFTNYGVEFFLTHKAEILFKNDKVLSFFTYIQSSIDDISKEELINYFETIRKGYEKTRLTNNPMTNMVRLWDFEVYAELIKHIDIMLNRYL